MFDFIGLKRLQIDGQCLKIMKSVISWPNLSFYLTFIFPQKIIFDDFETFRRENSNVWKWTEKESPLKKNLIIKVSKHSKLIKGLSLIVLWGWEL